LVSKLAAFATSRLTGSISLSMASALAKTLETAVAAANLAGAATVKTGVQRSAAAGSPRERR
jgi:hypothetical protein